MTLTSDLIAARFGYGLPLPEGAPREPADILALLEGPDHMRKAYPIEGLDVYRPLMGEIQAQKRAQKTALKDSAAYKRVQGQADTMTNRAARDTVSRALDSADGLRERLQAFWVNHFAVTPKARPAAYLPTAMAEEAIRPNMTGRFADLLIAAATHPAMVLYLDQDSSFGPASRRGKAKKKGLNENLGREVMELHSLGVNAKYSQTDVREMAKVLTGLTFIVETGATFDPERVEPGPATVLGKTYDAEDPDKITKALTDLAHRPETARHICTKLARHFLADTPPEPLVREMVRAWAATDGRLMAVYRVLVNSEEAAAPLAKARWPQDWMITCLRALGVTGADVQALGDGPFNRMILQAMKSMGQPLQRPPGPNGFSEAGEDWINPPYLAARISWAMTAPRRLVPVTPDPVALAQASLGARLSDALALAASRAETRDEGVGLVLASVEMNRR
jgi:uncharacterized protein (DUF1800 family)